jgi:hypothetical protein
MRELGKKKAQLKVVVGRKILSTGVRVSNTANCDACGRKQARFETLL